MDVASGEPLINRTCKFVYAVDDSIGLSSVMCAFGYFGCPGHFNCFLAVNDDIDRETAVVTLVHSNCFYNITSSLFIGSC